MAASGMFYEAWSDVVTALTDGGFAVVRDPRNARPMTVFVNPPTGAMVAHDVADITITLKILAAPPGNLDAAEYLVTQLDGIADLDTIAITTFEPTVTEVGDQSVPSYDVAVRLSERR